MKITFTARSAKGHIRNMSVQPRLGQDGFCRVFTDAVVEIKNGAVTPDHPVWSELLKRYVPARRYEIAARREYRATA